MTLEQAAQKLREAEQRKRDAEARYRSARDTAEYANSECHAAEDAVRNAVRDLYAIASPPPAPEREEE